jgi:hypothetical protein
VFGTSASESFTLPLYKRIPEPAGQSRQRTDPGACSRGLAEDDDEGCGAALESSVPGADLAILASWREVCRCPGILAPGNDVAVLVRGSFLPSLLPVP